MGNTRALAQAAAAEVGAGLRKFWEKDSGQGRRILAISGGVDSMVLLEGLSRTAPDSARARLEVLHVNHGLRGAESDADEALVLARARELGIPARAVRLTWGREKPSQDACRRAREAAYTEACAGPHDRVVLAHHLDDQAETLFLRLLRGTGVKGLAGMRAESGRKLRPLLPFPKSTLEAAARHWRIAWREDASNLSPKYERNWLRLEVLPLLEARRPGFAGRLAALAEEVQRGGGAPLGLFTLAPGLSFAKPGVSPGLAALREAYGLSRAHCRELAALLEKPGGAFHAEKRRFRWSAGVLLAEAGEELRAAPERTPREWRSVLGTWRFARAPGEALVVGGDSVKKEFQTLRVPVFFRAAVPVLAAPAPARGPRALLPRRLGELTSTEVEFIPSPLAAWWLGPDHSIAMPE